MKISAYETKPRVLLVKLYISVVESSFITEKRGKPRLRRTLNAAFVVLFRSFLGKRVSPSLTFHAFSDAFSVSICVYSLIHLVPLFIFAILRAKVRWAVPGICISTSSKKVHTIYTHQAINIKYCTSDASLIKHRKYHTHYNIIPLENCSHQLIGLKIA